MVVQLGDSSGFLGSGYRQEPPGTSLGVIGSLAVQSFDLSVMKEDENLHSDWNEASRHSLV